ncbi:MAG: cytochrome c [Planctomycetes bacterium]|nr:cytochrome c [Planctomycetota bacterium]
MIRYCISLLLLLAGCGPPGNIPGVTANTEMAAEAAFPAGPAAEDSLALSDKGKPMFQRFGCAACHSITAERSGLMGPPLGGLSDRVLSRHEYDDLQARRWLVKHIRDPQTFPSPYKQEPEYARTHMPPNPRISDEDMRALVEYLWMLR